jgi:hypothetical protein
MLLIRMENIIRKVFHSWSQSPKLLNPLHLASLLDNLGQGTETEMITLLKMMQLVRKA